MTQKLDITNSTFIRLALIILGIFFLYAIRDVLALLFITLIIVAGLYPTVDRWSRRITRPGAVVAIFIIIFLAIAGILSLIVPPLVSQIQEVSNNIPKYVNEFTTLADNPYLQNASSILNKNLTNLSDQLGNLGGTLFNQTVGVISGLVAVATIFVLSFYLLIEEEAWRKVYRGIIPEEFYENITDTTKKIAHKLGAWMRGQIVVMLLVGILTSLGLMVVGTPFALTLGVIAALGEIVPIIGQWVSGAIGVIVALTVSPLHALLALIIYVIVQQFETHVIIPKIMSKAVGLNPVAVIIAILIGYKLYGILGITLAVPLAAIIGVAVEDWAVIKETFSTKSH